MSFSAYFSPRFLYIQTYDVEYKLNLLTVYE
jgi:hypothetical protein